jgi:hypothetical protein
LIIIAHHIKTAGPVSLRHGTHTQSGRGIYFLEGDTYPLHQQHNLGRAGLGFTYWKEKRMWWIYDSYMTPSLAERLQKAGVDVSAYASKSGTTSPQSPPEAPVATQQPPITTTPAAPQPPATSPAVAPETSLAKGNRYNIDRSTEEMDWRDKRLSEKAGFPIKNIYTEVIDIEFEGKPVKIEATLRRRAKPGKSYDSVAMGWKGIPLYLVSVKLEGQKESFLSFKLPINNDETQPKLRWSQIDENKLVDLMREDVTKIFGNPRTKGATHLREVLQVEARDPAFAEFLKQNSSRLGKDEVGYTRDIQITDPPEYAGTYPVRFDYLDSFNNWHMSPGLQHPHAPSHRPILGSIDSMPMSLQNLQQFEEWMDKVWASPKTQQILKTGYAKWLRSFPFLQQQQDAGAAQYQQLARILNSNSLDVDYFAQQLKNRGFIGPRGGIVQRKVYDAAFRGGVGNETPDLFYAMLAYYMQRFHRNDLGFSSEFIGTMRWGVDQLRTVLARYGYEKSSIELQDYVTTLAKAMLKKLYNIRAAGPWERYRQFYEEEMADVEAEQTAGPERTGGPEQAEQARRRPSEWAPTTIDQFVSFATEMGVDANLAQTRPKAAYRQLTMKLHPDHNQNNPEWAHQQFVKLQEIWQGLPPELKIAASWWKRITCS